jgi:hypothetical protein
LDEGRADGGTQLADLWYALPTYWRLILDLGMQLNTAMFQANYQHGYILKPASLVPSSHPKASHHPTPYESKACRIQLSVNVISGQQLPRPKDYKPGTAVDPYVEVELICPTSTAEQRTRAVRDNEFNPMWDERLKFDMVTTNREFAFVRYVSPQTYS